MPIRRPALVAAVLAVALAVTAACGAPAPATPPPAPATAGYPVSIPHRYGTTEITAAPQRIVLVGLNEQDALLALGTVPVATSNFLDVDGGIFPWAEPALGDRPEPVLLDQRNGIPVEQVAALAPDLIVGLYSGLTEADHAALSRIAPTVAQPAGQEDFTISWQDTTLTLGRILGKEADARRIVDETQARVERDRAAHPEFAGKTGVAATFAGGYYFYSDADPRGRILTSLGFTFPTELTAFADGNGFGGTVPAERGAALDADALVWVGPPAVAEQLARDPVYSRLDVATRDRAVFLDANGPVGKAFTIVTPLSIPYLLDNLVPRLAAAVDGGTP